MEKFNKLLKSIHHIHIYKTDTIVDKRGSDTYITPDYKKMKDYSLEGEDWINSNKPDITIVLNEDKNKKYDRFPHDIKNRILTYGISGETSEEVCESIFEHFKKEYLSDYITKEDRFKVFNLDKWLNDIREYEKKVQRTYLKIFDALSLLNNKDNN